MITTRVPRGKPRPPQPPRIFTERWYGKRQAVLMANLAGRAPAGAVVEIGCWEGYSTYHIANAIYPRTLYAIDHWRGNVDERADHPSVLTAQQRNVYDAFVQNMSHWTRGNVTPIRADWRTAIERTELQQIAFIHVDASHDYRSVYDTLCAVWPRIVIGGVLCGDDYRAASADRDDLQGGVERAVKEFCAEHGLMHQTKYNGWWATRREL